MNSTNILDDNTHKQIHALAVSMAARLAADAPPDPLHPKQLLEEQLQLKIEQQILEFFERYVAGIKELMLSLITMRQTHPDIDLGEIFTELDKLGKGFSQLGQNPEETRSLRQICGISETAVQIFNDTVTEIYDKKEYERAAKMYAFLSFLEPNEPAYWLGYGNCEFFGQRYEKALPAYEMAVRLDGNEPLHHFYLAHCYHELNQKEQAVGEVEKALALIKSQPERKERIAQAEQLKLYFNEMAAKP